MDPGKPENRAEPARQPQEQRQRFGRPEGNRGIGEQKTQIDSAVKAVNESSSQWRTQINQLETQVDVVVDTVKQLEQQNQSQKDAIAELRNSAGGADQLKQRLDDIDAAIKAFDQYRIQVNNRLDRLEQ